MSNAADQAPKWRLAPGVYYRLAGEKVYVRNVTTRYDYFFNPMVKDILDLLKTERTKDELLEELGKTYALKKAPDFGNQLDRVLDSFTQKKLLLVRTATIKTDPTQDVAGTAKGHFQKNHMLWNVSFELTYLCNERCRHCYLDDPKTNAETGILRFDVWKKVIDEIADMGCVSALITGGEPTLHPDFSAICSYLVDRGVFIDLYTNALDISEDLFKNIVKIKPNTVSCSLYGGTPAFHDWITGVPGSFERTSKTILMFKCAGVDVFIKSVLFKGHAEEYEKLVNWADLSGVPVLCGQTVSNGRSGRVQSELNPDPETLRKFFETESKRDPFWNRSSVPPRDLDAPICGIGLSSFAIRPNGDISPCIQHPAVLGNVLKDSIQTIWKTDPLLESFRKTRFRDVSPKCATCEHSGFCGVCPGTAFEENGRLSPCSYSCWHAALKHEWFDSRIFSAAYHDPLPLPDSVESGMHTKSTKELT